MKRKNRFPILPIFALIIGIILVVTLFIFFRYDFSSAQAQAAGAKVCINKNKVGTITSYKYTKGGATVRVKVSNTTPPKVASISVVSPKDMICSDKGASISCVIKSTNKGAFFSSYYKTSSGICFTPN